MWGKVPCKGKTSLHCTCAPTKDPYQDSGLLTARPKTPPRGSPDFPAGAALSQGAGLQDLVQSRVRILLRVKPPSTVPVPHKRPIPATQACSLRPRPRLNRTIPRLTPRQSPRPRTVTGPAPVPYPYPYPNPDPGQIPEPCHRLTSKPRHCDRPRPRFKPRPRPKQGTMPIHTDPVPNFDPEQIPDPDTYPLCHPYSDPDPDPHPVQDPAPDPNKVQEADPVPLAIQHF